MIDSLLLHAEILWPALLAGILVLTTHVPLGQEVLRRGIVFLDLAIAQMAALGLVIAAMLGLDHHALWQNLIAVAAAVVGAMLLYMVRHQQARVQEALIGVLFMLAATGSILLLTQNPHGGERLKELLVGQILWTQPQDLVLLALVYAVVLFVWFKLRQYGGDWLFYPLFAVTITLSTQLVGIYLVFASLILPALATLHLRQGLLPAWGIGLLAYLLGLGLSAWLDLPAGAAIAWMMTLVAAGYYIMMKTQKR